MSASPSSPSPSESGSSHSSNASQESEVEEIKVALQLHNDSFDQLLRCIPAQYYFKAEAIPVPSAPLTKAQKKAAKKNAGLASVKAEKSDALRQAKLARYDPDEPKTIPEIQAAAAAAAKKGKSRATSSSSSGSGSEADYDESDSEGDDGSEQEDEEEEEDSPNDTDFADSDEEEPVAPNGLHHPRDYSGPEPTVAGLRTKLADKLAEIQAAKKGNAVVVPRTKDDSVRAKEIGKGGITGNETKEELLELRRKQRGLVRDNRRRKRKAERKDEKPKPVLKEGERSVPSNGRKGGGKANAPPREEREDRDDRDEAPPSKKSKATPPAPKKVVVAPTPAPALAVVKATPLPVAAPKPAPPPATIAFSTLDFSTSTLLAASALNPKKKNRHDLPKDANAALAILAGRKDKLDLLNPEQRERVDEKERWEKVGLKAGGEKVRDDEKRLKKMAKRQEKVKSKSAKAWAERKETVSSTITAKVTKRNNNMAARAQQMKDKKAGVKTKAKTSSVKTTSKSFAGREKGRAGFEGKKGKGGKK